MTAATVFGQVPVDDAFEALADLIAGDIDLEQFDERVLRAAQAHDRRVLIDDAWRRRS